MTDTASTGSKQPTYASRQPTSASRQPTSASRGSGQSSRWSLRKKTGGSGSSAGSTFANNSAVPSHHTLGAAYHLVTGEQGERKTSEGAKAFNWGGDSTSGASNWGGGGSSAAGASSSVETETYDDELASLYDHPITRLFGKKTSSESGATASNDDDDDIISWKYHPAHDPSNPPESARSSRSSLKKWYQNRRRDAQEEKFSAIPEDAPVQSQQNLPSTGGNFFTDPPTGHNFLAAPSITGAPADTSDNDGFTQGGSTLTSAFGNPSSSVPTVDPRTSFPGFTDRNIREARGFQFNDES